jgi:hypothetical protein
LLIAVALWLGIKVIPPVEPIPVSGNFEIPQGTPSDSKPLGQDFPAEDLLNVVNDSQRDISSRSAALSRLLRAKAIPDSAALSLISGLIDEASAYWSIPETDRPKVDAATAILEELATAVVVSPASMDFVLQNAKDSLNTDLAKNRDSSKAQRRLELWFQFFRKGFFGQPNVSFDFLNDAEFLAHHLCTLDRLLVNLTEGEARMLLASKVAGVRLLGSLQVAHDDRLQKDATFYSDAIEVIQQILDEPLGAGESSPVPAAVFDALIGPYGTFDSADKFVPSAIRILLDEKSHLARLANEYVIDNKSNRAVRDRFNSAVNYLKGACKYRKYSSDAESALREFLEKQAQAIAQLSPEKVERGKGDDRILASLDVLFEMNDAMLPLNERGKPDGRLQPGTIAVIDRLLGLDPKLLENLNLDHRRKRWLELKALQGHVLLRATMQSKTSLTKVHQSRVKML